MVQNRKRKLAALLTSLSEQELDEAADLLSEEQPGPSTDKII